MIQKQCRICGLPVDPLEYYGNHKSHHSCIKQKKDIWRNNNKDEIKRKKAEWSKENREHCNEYRRNWDAKNKEKIRIESENKKKEHVFLLDIHLKNTRTPKKERKTGIGSSIIPRRDLKREEFREQIRLKVKEWKIKNNII